MPEVISPVQALPAKDILKRDRKLYSIGVMRGGSIFGLSYVRIETAIFEAQQKPPDPLIARESGFSARSLSLSEQLRANFDLIATVTTYRGKGDMPTARCRECQHITVRLPGRPRPCKTGKPPRSVCGEQSPKLSCLHSSPHFCSTSSEDCSCCSARRAQGFASVQLVPLASYSTALV